MFKFREEAWMNTKVLAVVFSAIAFLSGCATAGKRQEAMQVKQLQSHVDFLEAELERKDQQICALEETLKKAQEATLKKRSGPLQLSVRQIQRALKNAGFYKGPVDGKMGPNTKEAIKAFQKAHGLRPDGIVGKLTSKELERYLSP